MWRLLRSYIHSAGACLHSAGDCLLKAGILLRRQNCLNLDIPTAYVALVEGAKASLN